MKNGGESVSDYTPVEFRIITAARSCYCQQVCVRPTWPRPVAGTAPGHSSALGGSRILQGAVSSAEYGAMLRSELLVGQGEHLGSRQVLILNCSFGNSLFSQKNCSPQTADNQGLQFL